MAISLVYDHVQRRQRDDRIGMLAGGKELNGDLWADVWIDPVTFTLQFRPPYYYEGWGTTSTGIFQRLGKSDYTLTSAGDWIEDVKNGAASKYVCLVDAAQESGRTAITTTTWGKNRGFYLSWFGANWGDDNFVQMECGWSNTGDGTAGVSLRFRASGVVEVWKDGVHLADRKISGSKGEGQTANTFISVVMVPMRRRELLVLANRGDGFSYVFDDIEEGDDDPTITAAAKFWWKVPSGKAEVECAPMRYATSGYATTEVYQMAEAPVETDEYEEWDNDAFAGGAGKFYKLFGDPAFAGTTGASSHLTEQDDADTPFAADGVKDRCRMRVDLTGDGSYSPFIYGTQIGFKRQPDDTSGDSQHDVTLSALRMQIEVPEEPSDLGFDVTFKGPEAIEANVPKFVTLSNRPVKIALGDVTIVDGLTEPPHFEESIGDEQRRVTVAVRDEWKALQDYIFRERVCFDGMLLEDAIRWIIELVKPDSLFDLDPTGFTIGKVPQEECGSFNAVAEIGDRAADWVKSLIEDYAANWFYGFTPTATGRVFQFKDPELLSTEPLVTLYESDEAYYTGESAAFAGDEWTKVFWSYKDDKFEAEANDIRVTGWDPRKRETFVAWKPDAASQDVTTPPNLRPDNWLGAKRRYGLIDPKITTVEMAETACEILFDRLTRVRTFAEWECNQLMREDGAPVWRGQVVRLVGKGDFRIVSLRTEFGIEDPHTSRPSLYVGEKIA